MVLPARVLVTPPGARLHAPALGSFARTWNRLLDGAALAHGMLTDRALLGLPTSSDTNAMLTRDPRRVPVALLRRFFFVDNNNNTLPPTFTQMRGDPDYFARTLTAEAAGLFQRANPFVREATLRDELFCADAGEVTLLLDMALGSLERAVWLIARDNAAAFFSHVAPVLHRALSSACPFWEGVPHPRLLDGAVSSTDLGRRLIDARLVVWAVIVWRITVAALVERALDLSPYSDDVPTPMHEQHAELAYQLHLFRDTHLDYLTRTVRTRQFSDEAFVVAAMAGVYPHALCVMCVEELPDMSDALPMANIWYDTGVRKTRQSALEAIAHVLACKMMNQKCTMRDLHKLVMDYANDYAPFNRLFKLSLHCTLLGNMPHAQCRLGMAARLRVHAAFLFEPGGASTPLDKSVISGWMGHSLYTLMFLLREMIFFAMAHDDVLAEIMDNNHRWRQHVRIVRACNGDVRRVLSHQAAKRPDAPFDWSQMQRVVLNRNGNPKKVGLVMKYHDAGLKAISKLRKSTWEDIVLNKMTSCNTFYGAHIHFDAAASTRLLERHSEALHLAAWAAARGAADEYALQTRWLQLFLTREGFARVRRWQFEYYVYDVSDHSLVDEIYALYKHERGDYVMLRAYILLVKYYRSRQLFFLPVPYALRQLHALRDRYMIEDECDTPALLGKCHICDRCEGWATPLVEPPFVTTADAAPTLAGGHGAEDDDAAVDDFMDRVELNDAALRYDERMTRKAEQSSYMSLSWYDPISNQLYCRRKHKKTDNPLADIYARIAELDSDGEDDDAAAGKKKKKKKKVRGATADSGNDAADDEDDEEEDSVAGEMMDFLLEHVDSLLAGVSAPSSSTAAAPAAGDAMNRIEAFTRNRLHGAPDTKPAGGRAARKVDPVDTFLMHYFNKHRGGRLKRIDMVGVLMATKNGIFGLCDECGMLIRVTNVNMTNAGISCLHHVGSHMRLDDPVRAILEEREQRRLRSRKYTSAGSTTAGELFGHAVYGVTAQPPPVRSHASASEGSLALRLNTRIPYRRIEPLRDAAGAIVRCFYCMSNAEHELLMYDRSINMCRVPLCTVDHNRATKHLPRGRLPSSRQLIDALADTSFTH